MKLICYLSNGYPTLKDSVEMANIYVEAGCDIIQIDFPARDPYLEGEFVANRMLKALEECDDYQAYMESIITTKKNLPNKTYIIVIYEDTIREIGYKKFEDFCLQNNFMDLVIVGTKDEIIKEKLISAGISVSCYVQFHLLDEEVASAKNSNGFVYLQAKPIMGNVNPKYPTLKDCVNYLRNIGIKASIYSGVGIYTSEDVKMAKEAGIDGVFVGSTILKLEDNVERIRSTIIKLKKEC